jgi:hypothetical protein
MRQGEGPREVNRKRGVARPEGFRRAGTATPVGTAALADGALSTSAVCVHPRVGTDVGDGRIGLVVDQVADAVDRGRAGAA